MWVFPNQRGWGRRESRKKKKEGKKESGGREGRVGERGAVLGLFSCRGQQRTRLARAVLELLKLAQ